jgi:uncharacterized protein DUF6365
VTRTLLVTPTASGETVTAVHVAQSLTAKGHAVAFVASRLARRTIPPQLARHVFELAGTTQENLGVWERALASFDPHVVVFADYHLLTSPTSSSPIDDPGWREHLRELDACLVTLDHFGFAQCDAELSFGPPHLSPARIAYPPLPDGIRIMLPCPMHHPGPVEGRRGEPFRYWDLPLGLPAGLRRQVRRSYLDDEADLLVVHSVPAWACRMAQGLELSFYRFLPDVFAWYFGGLGRRITVVSVNDGSLLPRSGRPGRPGDVRIRNLPPLPIADFERLLWSADLVITENKASISMGKAICGLQPSAAMTNSFTATDLMDRAPAELRDCVRAMEAQRPGSVFPYAIFPIDMRAELDKLCLYRGNALSEAFEEVELFGGEPTRDRLARLLTDPAAREALRERQQAYLHLLQQTPDAAALLDRYLEEHRAGQRLPHPA